MAGEAGGGDLCRQAVGWGVRQRWANTLSSSLPPPPLRPALTPLSKTTTTPAGSARAFKQAVADDRADVASLVDSALELFRDQAALLQAAAGAGAAAGIEAAVAAAEASARGVKKDVRDGAADAGTALDAVLGALAESEWRLGAPGFRGGGCWGCTLGLCLQSRW